MYYAMRFVDGLRVDIRNVVHLQRPSTLDIACMLALLQEEPVDPARRHEVRRLEPFTFAKAPVRGPMPLPPPPPRLERVERPAPVVVAPAERRGRGLDDKLNTIHDYWRARGLCIRCDEKWSRDHKCPEAVELHVLQELLKN
jgi:hypothetical protein